MTLPSAASDRYDDSPGHTTPSQLRKAPPGAMAAVGAVAAVGVDIVGVDRFAAALRRTPGLVGRLLTEAEQLTDSGRRRSAASLAARFAAKEAVAKALGVPRGMEWHDCVVAPDAAGRPALKLSGTVAAAAAARGIAGFELSLTHDAGIAAAIVVAVR